MSAVPGWWPCSVVPVTETSLGSEVFTLARVRSVTSSCLSLEIRYSLRPLLGSSARNLNKQIDYFIVFCKTLNYSCLQVEITRKTWKSQSDFLDTETVFRPPSSLAEHFSPGEHLDTGLLVSSGTPLVSQVLLQLLGFLLLHLHALLLEVIPPVVLQLGRPLLITPGITQTSITADARYIYYLELL